MVLLPSWNAFWYGVELSDYASGPLLEQGATALSPSGSVEAVELRVDDNTVGAAGEPAGSTAVVESEAYAHIRTQRPHVPPASARRQRLNQPGEGTQTEPRQTC